MSVFLCYSRVVFSTTSSLTHMPWGATPYVVGPTSAYFPLRCYPVVLPALVPFSVSLASARRAWLFFSVFSKALLEGADFSPFTGSQGYSFISLSSTKVTVATSNFYGQVPSDYTFYGSTSGYTSIASVVSVPCYSGSSQVPFSYGSTRSIPMW